MAIWKVAFAAIVLLIAASDAEKAHAEWTLDQMNAQIEKTNVIVGGICSGTIIDKEQRIVLTAYHCIDGQLVEEEVKEIDDKTGEIRTRRIQKRKPLEISVHKVVDYEIVSTMSYLVRIVGADSANDIAILQVTDADFHPEMEAKLAPDSFVVKRGIKVFAVGNPGVVYDNSITEGIISSPQRTIDLDGKSLKFFQHSAAIIGGNSGGSILNENGELVGTVSAGIRGTNIGFAVPISFTKDLIRRSGFASILEAP